LKAKTAKTGRGAHWGNLIGEFTGEFNRGNSPGGIFLEPEYTYAFSTTKLSQSKQRTNRRDRGWHTSISQKINLGLAKNYRGIILYYSKSL